MPALKNPAMKRFLSQPGDPLLWAQVLITRRHPGFELRHVLDRLRSREELKALAPGAARQIAQFTAAGAFRPLKSAPNLQSGWCMEVRDDSELEAVLNQLYPGSVADWFAAQSSSPPVTHYREFTGRQTGMYRITTKLNDAQVAQVIGACCHESLCLKRRLWSVQGFQPDPPERKSAIPCLEPCALLLELARNAVRLDQEEKAELLLGPGEAATLVAGLELALARVEANVREGDLSVP